MPQIARIVRPLAAAAFGTVMLLPGACGPFSPYGTYAPGGSFWSADSFCWESDEWNPKTITLVDTRTGQAFWSMDIPVGKELVVEFLEGRGDANTVTPDMMQWDIWPAGTRYGMPSRKLNVPGKSARRLDLTYRPVPELPEDMRAKPVETAEPVPMPAKPAEAPPPEAPKGEAPKADAPKADAPKN
jgi:hypothetical protein